MRFEIWLANLNPQRGTEIGKVRPVLIVQTDLFEGLLDSTLICPMTTQLSHSELTKIKIEPSKISGLKIFSWVVMDQVRAVDNKRLIEKIGSLPDTHYERVNRSLKIMMDLD
ncbi:MAG: type II toxin-antitoxin system PemK/MazF family toxin [Cyclobacteriaceae bacterium]